MQAHVHIYQAFAQSSAFCARHTRAALETRARISFGVYIFPSWRACVLDSRVRARMYTHLYIHVHVCACVNMYASMHLCTHTYAHASMQIAR